MRCPNGISRKTEWQMAKKEAKQVKANTFDIISNIKKPCEIQHTLKTRNYG